MIADVAVSIEFYPDGIVLIIRKRNPFESLADSYGAEFLINIQIILRKLRYERIFFVRNDRVNQDVYKRQAEQAAAQSRLSLYFA